MGREMAKIMLAYYKADSSRYITKIKVEIEDYIPISERSRNPTTPDSASTSQAALLAVKAVSNSARHKLNKMESKIFIDISTNRQERILIQQKHTEDVRDKLLAMFLQTALPDGGSWKIRDGYCRLSILGDDQYFSAEIVPIHPTDAPGHIEIMSRNAETFQVSTSGPIAIGSVTKKEDPEMIYADALAMIDCACAEKLPERLYKQWKNIMFNSEND